MAGGRDWTTTEARKLHELRARRVRARDIARVLGRTEAAVHNFIRYVPVSPGHPPSRRRVPRINRWTVEETAALRELAKRGTSLERAALTLRRTPSAVRNRAQIERVSLLSERHR